MPLYFIDTDDGEGYFRDGGGIELTDREAAKAHVYATLDEMVKARGPEWPHETIYVGARDAIGVCVFDVERPVRARPVIDVHET